MERNGGQKSGNRGPANALEAAYMRQLEIRKKKLADPFGGRTDSRTKDMNFARRIDNFTAASFSPKKPE